MKFNSSPGNLMELSPFFFFMIVVLLVGGKERTLRSSKGLALLIVKDFTMNWPPNLIPFTSELGLKEKSEFCFVLWSLGCWCFCFLFLFLFSFAPLAIEGFSIGGHKLLGYLSWFISSHNMTNLQCFQWEVLCTSQCGTKFFLGGFIFFILE